MNEETPPAPKLNLYQKIIAIAAAAEKMRKDGTNTHHKYKFFSHGLVTATVRDLMLEHGLVTHVTMRDGSCVVTLINAESPHPDEMTGSFDVPRPNDQPQSTGAIMSYAVKLMYQKTFMLEDADTPDVETMQPKNKPAETKDFDNVLRLLKDASGKDELSAIARDLDQSKFSKDQWNTLSNTYKERLSAVSESK
jgi:hypothetical protein